MGHTSFWAKETNFTSFLPQGSAAAPKKQATGRMSKGRAFATKSPANARAFQFSVTSW
jgi:hypothetical protein